MSKGALRVDKAIHELFEGIPNLLCEQPYGEKGRYITYYAEERLYLVFDLYFLWTRKPTVSTVRMIAHSFTL